tara:strand:- start:1888 stop:2919 length:1032 start_codon:yes stop_codon:yes gene_type:complete
MAINLNRQLVSKKGLLEYLKDIDVFRLYSGQEVDLSKPYLSFLRPEENSSFGYFIGESGEICYNDFVLGTGDCIRFVELKFGFTFFEALSQIATDFNLTSHFKCKNMLKTNNGQPTNDFKSRADVLKSVNINKLGVRARAWTAYDLLFWEQFGVPKSTLEYYNVKPIDYIFFDENKPPIKADKYAYVFYEYKDGNCTMKIYQPFSKGYKWLNNHDDSVWQGWAQLPKIGKELIITKSLKDVMSIVSVLGIPAVSLQSESIKPKERILDELDNRFEINYLLYDNDFTKDVNIGRAMGAKIVDDQQIIQLEIPDEFECKDFSDLIKKYGQAKAKEIFDTRIAIPY